MATNYDQIAGIYEVHAADSAYNAHYERPAVLALVGDVGGLHVLDAGCGPGIYSEELAARGAKVVAVDVSPSMVELARRRLGARAEVFQADLNDPLPFGAEAFDLVVCALVIHHLESRAACLDEFSRVLKPGGRLVVSTHHPTADWLRSGGSYFETRQEEVPWFRESGDYTVRFWREPLGSLCAAIAEGGFLIERLVEPQPAATMEQAWPEQWEKLRREPGFLILRLVKHQI